MLDGYENLAKDSEVHHNSNPITELNDLNLETKITTCTAGAACEVEMIMPSTASTAVHGIFKVVLYGSSESSDMAGWTVSTTTVRFLSRSWVIKNEIRIDR